MLTVDRLKTLLEAFEQPGGQALTPPSSYLFRIQHLKSWDFSLVKRLNKEISQPRAKSTTILTC
eukprot:1156966-Pelagomonas_calceolata.AAC.2